MLVGRGCVDTSSRDEETWGREHRPGKPHASYYVVQRATRFSFLVWHRFEPIGVGGGERDGESAIPCVLYGLDPCERIDVGACGVEPGLHHGEARGESLNALRGLRACSLRFDHARLDRKSVV